MSSPRWDAQIAFLKAVAIATTGLVFGCAREYDYFPPWSIVDEAWAISFNASGAVIHTAHFVSP